MSQILPSEEHSLCAGYGCMRDENLKEAGDTYMLMLRFEGRKRIEEVAHIVGSCLEHQIHAPSPVLELAVMGCGHLHVAK